jgi:hypothetical protein
MKMVRASWPAAVFTAALLTGGCEHGLLVEPAPRSATIALSLSAENAAGGPAQAFDKADAVWIQVRSGDSVRVELTIPMQSGGNDVPVSLEVPLNRATESFVVNAEVRRGSDVLFRGSAPLELRAGTIQVALTLTPVGHSLALPATLPTLTAYGDSVRVNGAIVFATLDTVSVVAVTTWTSLDPTVVAIVGGVPVARTDGDARLIGQVGALQDTTTVRVFAAVQTITIVPNSGPMPLGTTRQFSAQLFDRRNNRLNRPVSWTTSNPAVLTIDQTGLATAISVGSALVGAASGSVTATLPVQVRAVAPGVVTNPATFISVISAVLNATVHPNGLLTDAWFEIGTDSALSETQTTSSIEVPAGSNPVPISLQVSLAPAVTYFVRAHARNAGGITTGNIVSFTTATPSFSVTTGSATNIDASSATLRGTISTDSLTASTWFELSTDSAFRQVVTTPPIDISPITYALPLTEPVGNLLTGRIYFFRVVARNATGTIYGNASSFIPRAPQTLSRPRGRAREE